MKRRDQGLARDVFLDRSDLYALADRRGAGHRQAAECVRALPVGGARLLLTDYILDEAVTLARVRAGAAAAVRLIEIVERSAAFSLVWIGAERFGGGLEAKVGVGDVAGVKADAPGGASGLTTGIAPRTFRRVKQPQSST